MEFVLQCTFYLLYYFLLSSHSFYEHKCSDFIQNLCCFLLSRNVLLSRAQKSALSLCRAVGGTVNAHHFTVNYRRNEVTAKQLVECKIVHHSNKNKKC